MLGNTAKESEFHQIVSVRIACLEFMYPSFKKLDLAVLVTRKYFKLILLMQLFDIGR